MSKDELSAEATARRLGAEITASRQRLGLSQGELAELAGIDRFYLSDLEHGKQTKHLQRLVEVLDTLGLELSVQPRTLRLGREQAGGDLGADDGDQ